MRVKKLIKILKGIDKNLEVVIQNSNDEILDIDVMFTGELTFSVTCEGEELESGDLEVFIIKTE